MVDYCNSTAFPKVKPILDSWFSTFGSVKVLKSDGGPPFNVYEFKKYAEERGFTHKIVKPRHLRGNGEVERFMQNIKRLRELQETKERISVL